MEGGKKKKKALLACGGLAGEQEEPKAFEVYTDLLAWHYVFCPKRTASVRLHARACVRAGVMAHTHMPGVTVCKD